MSPAILEISGLTLATRGASPVTLVNDVSLTLERGGAMALVGESGAGKSLTSLAVMGLLPAGVARLRGRAMFDGRDLGLLSFEEARRLRGKDVSMILQNPMSAFDPVFSIYSHFYETVASHEPGRARSAIRARAREALSSAGFETPDDVLSAYPFQLSGGMLQRVMIALALIEQPKLLIADEATTDLDAVSQKLVVDLLRHYRRTFGLSLFVITHDLGVAAYLGDSVAVMQNGRIVESGTVKAVFSAPRHGYTQAFMAAYADMKPILRVGNLSGEDALCS